jgi:hypothetical protein
VYLYRVKVKGTYVLDDVIITVLTKDCAAQERVSRRVKNLPGSIHRYLTRRSGEDQSEGVSARVHDGASICDRRDATNLDVTT